MVLKHGLKRQLESDSEDEHASAGASSSTSIAEHKNGMRNRLEAERHADLDARSAAGLKSNDLPLNMTLKKRWASGELSSPAVQEIALSAMEQGAFGIDHLAKLGKAGSQPGNVFRDLCSALGMPLGAPAMQWVRLPLANRKSSLYPVLMPHRFFQQLYLEQGNTFHAAILGGCDDVHDFWESPSGKQLAAEHPVLQHRRRHLLHKTVPLGLYGDGGQFNKQDSLYVITWNSLVGLGTTSEKKMIFTIIKKSQLTPETWDKLWEIFAWSVNVLLHGREPETDHLGHPLDSSGSPLADDFSGCCIQIRGDWAFFSEVLHFPRPNEVVNNCWICKAGIGCPLLRYTDATDSAGWRPTIRTTESYMMELISSGQKVPILFKCVTGLRLEHATIDTLHAVDQGVAAHVVGNVFWECMSGKAANQAEQIKALSEDLKLWYKKNPSETRIRGKLSVDRLRSSSGFVKFKGKAAETRHLVPYAVDLAVRCDDGSEHSARRIAVVRLLNRFYIILNENDMFISAGDLDELKNIGKNLTVLYNALSVEAATNMKKIWKFVPKFNLFVHLCEIQSAVMNPRFFWTYSDEDLVGQLCEVARTCHPNTMGETALYKYLLLHFD